VTGNSDKLDAFIAAIDNRLIVEVVRSGAIGIARGDRALRL
jgi:acetolactate synthase-1/3 small subunit